MLRLKTILQYNFIYIVIILSALLLAFLRNEKISSKYDIKETHFEGILTSYKIDGDKLSFELKGKEQLRCTYYIKTEEEKKTLENLDLGVTLELVGTLSIPSNNTIPNTFNYKKYLKNNNISYVLNVQNFKVINNKTSTPYFIKNQIIKHIKSYKSKDYLSAFITGDKTTMDDEIKNEYQTLGVSHIFAISGMHISLLSTVIIFVLKKLKIKENISYIIVIIFLLFYMFITSFQASIIRSVGLFILLYVNKRWNLDIKVMNVLLLDISIILYLIPNFLFNVGFLYSSVVSFSLIKYSHLIKGNYLMKCLKVSLIAFLFSLPITIMNNYEFNLLTVINNLIIVPLVSLILYPLSVLTFFLPILDNVLLFITNLLENITPFLLAINIVIPKVHFFVIIVYYIFLILFFESYKKTFLLCIVLLLVIVKVAPYFDTSYQIYFLDVGQGDSIVIKQGRECLLIDTGGKVNFKTDKWKEKKEYYYTDNTVKFLKSIGVSSLNTVVLTHGDADHMGETINLVNKFKVEKVIFNCGEYNDLENKLIKVLHLKNIEYSSCIKELDINNNRLNFLKTKEYNNENDNSNVLYADYNGFKFLFMGDASSLTETEIMNKYNLSNIDVLKVGHHGSKTSSEKTFIDKIKPKYSIISVGKNNRYGHPNKEVLNNLNDSKIYRTDIDGSIIFKINKKKLNIKTCPP